MLALAAATAWAQPAVENLSSTSLDGVRTLAQRMVVPAAAETVWQAWTSADALRTWMAPVVGFELRIGGVLEASYDPAKALGDPANIRNQVLAYVPGRMLAMRNINAPPKVPFDVAAFQSLHTVVLIDALGPQSAAVTVVQPGYGSGEGFDGVYRFFERGNAITLQMLHDRFAKGPIDWAKPAR